MYFPLPVRYVDFFVSTNTKLCNSHR